MKILITTLIIFFGVQVFGQTLDSLFAGNKLPKGLKVTVKKEGGIFPHFPRNYIGTAFFKSNDIAVYYHIFPYQPTDSAAVSKAEHQYWMVSGCNMSIHKNFHKNFRSFTKGGYYFLLQYCACRTTEDKNCAALAKRINQWRK
jgi:putative aminopeptidase FrvX